VTILVRIDCTDRAGTIRSFEIPAADYFDEVEDGVSVHELVPKHPNALSYVPLTIEQLCRTSLRVISDEDQASIEVVEEFWCEGKCRTISRVDRVGERLLSQLRILEIGVEGGAHFLRLGADGNDVPALLEHHFVSLSDDVEFLFPEDAMETVQPGERGWSPSALGRNAPAILPNESVAADGPSSVGPDGPPSSSRR